MAKSDELVKFERLSALFLEFESDFGELANQNHTDLTVDLQKEEFRTLWEDVKAAYQTFMTSNVVKDSEEECDQAKQLFKECRLAYITLAAQMGELARSFVNKSVLSSTQVATASSNTSTLANRVKSNQMKLPPCTTEIFRGDYQSWPSFRDMFTAVYINGVDLSDVERLFYLRQNTRDEALEIVQNSPLTNDGFQSAWENLRERYENKRILVNSQLKVLFNLAPVKIESAVEIKRLQRDINKCISALNLHRIDISNWDPIFVYLCSTKLPVLTLSLWEQTIRDKTEIPKWKDFSDFLTSRFQSLETVSDIRSAERSTSTEKLVNRNSANSGNNASPKKRVKTYQTRVVKKSCVLCSKDHFIRFCAKFSKMSPGERFLIAKKHNLCLNCLSEGHKISTCQSKFSCSKCKLKHHSMLHREVSAPASSDDSTEGPSTSQAAQNNIQNCFATTSKQILLGTAMVNIDVRGEVFLARALIDPGSQATFISEKLQRKLNLPVRKINAQVSGLNDALAGSVHKKCEFTLSSPLDSALRVEVEGLVLPKLTGKLPSHSIDVSQATSLLGLKLADPNFSKSNQVDLLIGADIYPKIMGDGVKRNILGDLMAQETLFGWILTGPLPRSGQLAFTTSVSFLDKQLDLNCLREDAHTPALNRWQVVRTKGTNWRNRFLIDLRRRNGLQFVQKNLKVGDMALTYVDNSATDKSVLGRVEKLHIDKNGHVRVVELRTERGLVTRPVVKLVVLPTV